MNIKELEIVTYPLFIHTKVADTIVVFNKDDLYKEIQLRFEFEIPVFVSGDGTFYFIYQSDNKTYVNTTLLQDIIGKMHENYNKYINYINIMDIT